MTSIDTSGIGALSELKQTLKNRSLEVRKVLSLIDHIPLTSRGSWAWLAGPEPSPTSAVF